MIASPTIQPSVAVGLLDYLRQRLAVPDLQYAKEPSPITCGWETYIYRFRLQRAFGLPARLAGPLILRVYSSIHGIPRVRHEFAAQEQMQRLNYPVARPLLLEPNCNLFGGPFMVMEQAPGQTLLELLLQRPWRIWGGPAQMADVHAWLHRLPADDFPCPAGSFLERRLEEMRGHLRDHGLGGMLSGLDWLSRHRPEPPRTPRIIHLDFHPVNVLFHADQCSAVLDWSESDVGDHHADVAATLVLMRSAPVEVPTVLQRCATWPGRLLLRRRYLRAYRRRIPLDRDRLAYYIAWAAFRRLLNWGMWLHATPRITGCKPSSMRYLNADRVNILRDCFHSWAGVAVQL